jgi:hypothetical protein
MRYYEFIVEYKTDITRSNHGEKILDKLGIQKQINSGYGKGKNAVADPQGVYQQTALMSMGISLNPYVDGRPVSPYSLLTQELYDENKNKILDDMLETFESFDPTPNKQYTQHIVKWYLSDNVHAFPNIEDGTSTLRQSLGDFNRMKERLPERYRDIAQYTSAKNFMDSVQYFKEEYGKQEKLDKGESEIVYNSKYATIYWPKDEQGSCYLGQGTQWCTASTRSANYFDQYNKDGPLVIVNMKEKIRVNDGWVIDDDGGETEDPYGEKYENKIQAHMEVDSDGEEYLGAGSWRAKKLWTWDHIADTQDEQVDFTNLYDDNPNFKAMWDSPEFQKAMDNLAEKWWDYNGLELQNSPNGD